MHVIGWQVESTEVEMEQMKMESMRKKLKKADDRIEELQDKSNSDH